MIDAALAWSVAREAPIGYGSVAQVAAATRILDDSIAALIAVAERSIEVERRLLEQPDSAA